MATKASISIEKILKIRCSGPGKTSGLVNPVNQKLYTNKIYLYVTDPDKAKYQLLINKRGGASLKHCNDSKDFVEL